MATQKNEISSDDKIWGAISYFWILSVVALAARKNNEYVRFHANQGVLLFVLSLLVIVPIIGWLISVLAWILAIVGIIKSLQGEKWPLPLLDEYAVKFGNWLEKTLNL